MKYQPGHPGGPGRPKGSGRIKVCEEWADKKGIPALLNLAEGKNGDGTDIKSVVVRGRVVRLGPSEEIIFEAKKLALAYGKGRPSQAVEVSGPEGGPIETKDVAVAALNELDKAALEALAFGTKPEKKARGKK